MAWLLVAQQQNALCCCCCCCFRCCCCSRLLSSAVQRWPHNICCTIPCLIQKALQMFHQSHCSLTSSLTGIVAGCTNRPLLHCCLSSCVLHAAGLTILYPPQPISTVPQLHLMHPPASRSCWDHPGSKHSSTQAHKAQGAGKAMTMRRPSMGLHSILAVLQQLEAGHTHRRSTISQAYSPAGGILPRPARTRSNNQQAHSDSPTIALLLMCCGKAHIVKQLQAWPLYMPLLPAAASHTSR